MDDDTALKIFEDYFAGRADRAQFEAALDYFDSVPTKNSRLAELYRALLAPGGISHETARAEMLRYSDPLARREMSAAERAQFLLHLSHCAGCAEEFLELKALEEAALSAAPEPALPRFKVPSPPPVSWPRLLRPVLNRLADHARQLKLELYFAPPAPLAVPGMLREIPAAYKLEPEEIVLFSPDQGPRLLVDLYVTASRATPQAATCAVNVRLQGLNLPLAGHRLTLRYDETLREEFTDAQGRAVFGAVPVSALPSLHLEIDLSFPA